MLKPVFPYISSLCQAAIRTINPHSCSYEPSASGEECTTQCEEQKVRSTLRGSATSSKYCLEIYP